MLLRVWPARACADLPACSGTADSLGRVGLRRSHHIAPWLDWVGASTFTDAGGGHMARSLIRPGRWHSRALVLSADTPITRLPRLVQMATNASARCGPNRDPRMPRTRGRGTGLWSPVLVCWSVVEVVLRQDTAPRPLLLLAVLSSAPLLWRRTHPLVAVAVSFGVDDRRHRQNPHRVARRPAEQHLRGADPGLPPCSGGAPVGKPQAASASSCSGWPSPTSPTP